MSLLAFRDRYPVLIDHLLRARAGGRIAHGYLITGDNPATLGEFAEAWIRATACRQPVDGDACGTCDTCQRLARGTYPDRLDLRPVSKSRQIRIDEVRELEQFLSHRSDGHLRIGAIHDADCMNEAAQNAFLKTLEEPSPDTMLLLIAARPARMLATIRSRCQSLMLHDNRLTYDFAELPELRQALLPLRRGAGAQVAQDAATALSTILGSLKEKLEKEVEKAFMAEHKGRYELPADAVKRLEEQASAAGAAAYVERRDAILSAIHTWYATRLALAAGAPFAAMANPELFNHTPPEPLPTPDAAAAELACIESLLDDLQFNIDEELAITDCCMRLARRA